MDYTQYMGQNGLPKWPYPVEYGEETEDSSDILIIGGGLSGCFAAIHAAMRGAHVTVVEKGATIRSGSAGTGIDHWMFCATNPGSTLSPDEMLKTFIEGDPFASKHMNYVVMNEAYEALLDFESMGMKVRDTDDLFKGAPFRDEETKLLYAYDYDSKYCIRIFGVDLKKYLYRKMKALGVKIYDRVMATMLLTEDGKQGGRVIGAVGVNVRTGRFCIFKAKATVLATAKPLRLWELGMENCGTHSSHDDPNGNGDGDVMAWRAGAKLTTMERTEPSSGMHRYPCYGTGNAHNTWYPATIVDAEGKELPWVDRDGKVLDDPDQRSRCAPGQKCIVPRVQAGATPYEIMGYTFPPDMADRIRGGEFKYPFYADLTDMPEYERRVIFNMMLCNEGKTRVPVLRYLGGSGFDPSRDMLQANILPPEIVAAKSAWWKIANGSANIRDVAFTNYGGLVVDWDTKTSLEGLYAIGNQIFGVEGASTAAALGRYCGRIIAKHKDDKQVEPCRAQIDEEKKRVYRFLENEDGYGWKEVQIGMCRIMQDYAGAIKTKEIMETGLWWLNTIRETELDKIVIHNPHELERALESEVRLTAGEIILHSSLARKSSSKPLSFKRLDYPEEIPPKDDNFIVLHQENGKIVRETLPLDFWLKDGNKETYLENYSLRSEGKEVRP